MSFEMYKFLVYQKFYYNSKECNNLNFESNKHYFVGFLDKNRDTFSADLRDLISHSKCEFLYNLFSREKSMVSFCETLVSEK